MTWTQAETDRVAALEASVTALQSQVSTLQSLNSILNLANTNLIAVLKSVKNIHRPDPNGNCVSCVDDTRRKYPDMPPRLAYPCTVTARSAVL